MSVDNTVETSEKTPESFNEYGEILRSSPEWSIRLRVNILDADGWDRQNFLKSWNEKITESEFTDRMNMSTVQRLSVIDLMGW